MKEMTSNHHNLEAWYGDGGRDFIEQHSIKRLAAFDSDFEKLKTLEALSQQELTICFLGASGVGKSTLINVLVADGQQVLPQGGVGPLTAQATVVKHSKDQRLRATYLPSKYFNRMLFALERAHELELKRSGQQVNHDVSAATAELLDEEDRTEIEDEIPDEEIETDDSSEAECGSETRGGKAESYVKRVSLLICGEQNKERDKRYLADSLRECRGKERIWGTDVRSDDAERIRRLQEVIALSSKKEHSYEVIAAEDPESFYCSLSDHASGFLAPAISTLEVFVDAPTLKNRLVFVDLPGLGVANDEYQTVTSRWIREASAVVLVVDRSGITQASAQLLQSTGFLTSLLHDADEVDAIRKQLIIAVVKLDMSASDERRREKTKLRSGKPRRWSEHFDEVCSKMKPVVEEQLRTELQKIYDEGGKTTREERRRVMDGVLASLQIHTISAIDYRMYIEDDEDEPPRIKTAESSRIPQLRESLAGIADENAERVMAVLNVATEGVRERTRATVQLTLAKWEQEERAQEEAEKLRAELNEFIRPLEREYYRRQGEFKNYLDVVIPEVIERSVAETSLSALQDIGAYLEREFEEANWATIRAAMRRDGRYDGATDVNIPGDITQLFEEPIAVAWRKNVLNSMRNRTTSMGKEQAFLVGKIADWARGQGARVKPTLVEALHDDLKVQTNELGKVGQEAISELKNRVRTELNEKVAVVVHRRCKHFVRKKQDVGVGVKNRMHKYLRRKLAPAVIAAAKPVALEVLDRNYRVVAEEVREKFNERPNPIDAAVDAIVSAEEQFIRRSDAQKRKSVIRAANEHLVRLEVIGRGPIESDGAST